MANMIDICATDDTGIHMFDYRFMAGFGRGTEIRVVSVMDMIYQVLALVTRRNVRVSNLYINGHGAPAYQNLGAGIGIDLSGARSIQLDQEMSALYTEPSLLGVSVSIGLTELGGIWADHAMVTLLGCKVAEGPEGKKLLRAAAKVMGVWVRAFDATQCSWWPGYEGQVWYSDPYGTTYRGNEFELRNR